ncbi:DUF1835 domain-containing protein [Mucilaginibacter ginsenosidivorans]|uniref:DUF1835 domain-containing protein n=2 Tax=Mucilaginibacter ginsenosidivorans TaxID=398053 RepID=A0A5B8URE9_9SPHI|nr:DUF1835 domain-containing protein [Mucilaginibacter ginsenosidivorans]
MANINYPMQTTLHVLNGSSTAHVFRETGIPGDILVWREIFSQGPLSNNVSSADFWETRKKWIARTFKELPEEYQKTVVEPLEMLKEPYETINLWFEFDLHCQANLLGMMALLAQNTNLSPPAVFLICPGEFPGKPDFKGMGELQADELEYLYENIIVQLGEIDFVIAGEAWKLYVATDTDALEKWLNETEFWGNMHLLKPAMQAHLKRLRTNEAGLNYIEQKLLDIYSKGAQTRHTIYQRFWKDEKIYGLGDTEIDLYLQPLIDRQLIRL